ncbi:glycogen debranching protein GlgX [candidate division KSB1 bacterium]|nr:glycogen debranching protein GlgX [candidate division KSB1 bacterium]
MQQELQILPGRPLPLGAHLKDGGAHFALFSRHATNVWLLLFDNPEDTKSHHSIQLNAKQHRTGDIWHVEVKGVSAGQLYAWRVAGPYDPANGHRFNPNKLLVDPYARALSGNYTWDLAGARGYDPASPEKDRSYSTRDDAAGIPKCILLDDEFDWQGDKPLNYPLGDCIIYETHVRGLTLHPTSGAQHPGTFEGIVEKIPYFKELGITSLELLPVQEFDELEIIQKNPITGDQLENYWGYSTIAFFAPKSRYCSGGQMGEQVTAFKTMVRELHKAGIEVILDIVLNHTSEGNETGPTLCFRGLDNVIYYLLEKDRRFYKNYSGCGNTLNCNHPIVRDFVLDCLRYWVIEMHVDGFRFDLASILGRGEDGEILENPPLVNRIAEDPILRNTKIIAEAWDAAGAYQVGSFPGKRWAEWNGRYRDDIRRFWRGDSGLIPIFATRIAGSSDLYQDDGRQPFHSINFITCHDGFTLNDLVSYNEKHNEANGEENRDGSNDNNSFNFGVEGITDDPKIEKMRKQQIKNLLTTLLISQGTPMLLGGDEFRRTQNGNNNAYCQNNEISWYDWSFIEKHPEIFRFFKTLIALRRKHPIFRRPHFFAGIDRNHNHYRDIHWFDHRAQEHNWNEKSRTLTCILDGSSIETGAVYDDNDVCIMVNIDFKSRRFRIPNAPPGKKWFLSIDTSKESPDDILPLDGEKYLQKQTCYTLSQRSMVVLFSFWA